MFLELRTDVCYNEIGDAMKILKMKKLKSGKYQIKLSNMEILTTYDDVILKYNLLFDKEITSELLKDLYAQTKYYDIYYKVVKYLSVRMRSTYEIHKYLKKYQVLKEEEDKLIRELQGKGLLNDALFAKAYASDKMHLSNFGPDKIRSDLKALHIDESFIEDALGELEQSDIEETLDKIIQKKWNTNRRYSEYQWKEKVLLELVQKGYPRSMVQEHLEHFSCDDYAMIEKEYERQKKKLGKKYQGKDLIYQIKGKLYQKGYTSEDINRVLEEDE